MTCPSLQSVIIADLDAVLVAAGEHRAAPLGQGGTWGTWRPAPAPADGTRSYATSFPFALARDRGGDPAALAGPLAARLRGLPWVETAQVTGGGYVTVSITPAALAALPARVALAGPACARSTALAGLTVTARRDDALITAATWEDAQRRLSETVTGRLAEVAGAHVHWLNDEKDEHERLASPGQSPPAAASPVAGAIRCAGLDAITFALARLPPGSRAWPAARAAAEHVPANPAYAVRYAHAHAASTLRQAADLGLSLGEAAGSGPRPLAHPSERSLAYELSWLPERAAGAARRRQPDVLARYLERLAGAYLSCQEQCPAVWPGMDVGAAEAHERLWLPAAARTALAAGLSLLGVSAPARL
jgi:arginyl-tRNA synthetase